MDDISQTFKNYYDLNKKSFKEFVILLENLYKFDLFE